MSNEYWAEFKQIGKDVFRFNTRIYLDPISTIESDDRCLGAVVGINPGSAVSSAIGKGIQEIKLNGDGLLPNVRSIVKKSYKEAKETPPVRGYVQVLNLFYLCNPVKEEAISEFAQHNKVEQCPTENQSFPWVWYVWGEPSNNLNHHKIRFKNLKTKQHFYYDNNSKKVVFEPASDAAWPRHTRGFEHNLIVPDISKVIKNVTCL